MIGTKELAVTVVTALLFSSLCSLICINKKDMKYISLIITIYILFSVFNIGYDTFDMSFDEFEMYHNDLNSRILTISEHTKNYLNNAYSETEDKND